MVYVTGDCHADFKRFSAKEFPDQKEMTRDDVVIVCGDFGLWNKCDEEDWWLNWLNRKSFTTVFVDGNHENFDRLYSDEFKIVDFHGGKAHKIRSHIYHLMRGYIFEFDGKKFWAFGGAQSHDIQDGILDRDNYPDNESFLADVKLHSLFGMRFRINHVSWWEQELPTKDEMDFGIKQLEANNNEVDYIITHCCPQEIATINGFRGADIETMFFNDIARKIKFNRWYFGHYHDNRQTYGKFIMLYNNIERIL